MAMGFIYNNLSSFFCKSEGFSTLLDEWESDDDDEEEGEWMDVYHSSDEAEEVISLT